MANHAVPAGTQLNLDLEATVNALLIPEDVSLILLKRRVGATGWESPEKLDLVKIYIPGHGNELHFRDTVVEDLSQYEEIVLVFSNGMWYSESDFVNFWYTLELTRETTPPDVRLPRRIINRGDPCDRQIEFTLTAVDNESGLVHIKVSPDPSIDQPLNYTAGQVFTNKLFVLSSGESRTITVEATDHAGNVTRRDFTAANPPPPGCDNPDDNFSAASAQAMAVSLPPAARALPKVAVLNNGFPDDTAAFLTWVGEPVDFVNDDFDPAAALNDFPVLVIPSGGLYGLSGSAIFRARLEEYARLGGVILTFDQQRGDDYSVLPGGELSGYGWSQDTSCFVNGLYLAASHPILSGFDKSQLTLHADGYFTTWPDDSTILLRRTANGQPGALVYPFGEGWVFATTMYDDWGIANGQYAEDARILVRDLISWALAEGELPTYRPGETVSLSIPITNTGSITATAVELALVSPVRQFAFTHTLTTTIGPGQSIAVPFTTSASLPLGIWNVEPTLFNGPNPISNLQPLPSSSTTHRP